MSITKIATVTIPSGGAASVDLTDIPQTFTDLLIVASLRNGSAIGATGGRAFRIMFNGYLTARTTKWLNGNGSSASSASDDYFWATASDSTASTFGSTSIYIPRYSVTGVKSYLIDSVGENNASLAEMSLSAHRSGRTEVVSFISIAPTLVGNIAADSTITVYGITNGTYNGVTVS